MSIRTEEFFTLDSSPLLRELFGPVDYFWEVLDFLHPFLLKQPLGTHHSPVPAGVILEHPETIAIGLGCVLEPGCTIIGPTLLEDNVRVAQGAYIRGGVIACRGSVIGHASEIKQSILFPYAKAAHFNYVGDSILGVGVNLGAGVKLANVRLDKKPIALYCRGQVYPTGRAKLGAFIGDGAALGCNCVTNPGALLPRGGRFVANSTISNRLFWKSTA